MMVLSDSHQATRLPGGEEFDDGEQQNLKKMTTHSEKKEIVIIGGGIIGCTSAYFLSRHPAYDPSKHRITLLEASKIAGGASGKAGGLLALWAYPTNIVPLSYRLHAELAKEHGGESRWGYRRIHCGQLSAKGRSIQKTSAVSGKPANGESVSLNKRDEKALGKIIAAGLPKDLNWFTPECVRSYYEMGGPDTTAQVHPYFFTTSMADLAKEKGVNIVLGAVSNIDTDDGNGVKAVTYEDKATKETHTIPATDIIVSAGPWSRRVYPPAPISGMRAHSVTITPSKPISAYAIFTEISLPSDFGQKDTFLKLKRPHGKTVTPEIYARPNNEAYACGEGDHLVPLPKTTEDVETDMARCQDIIDYVSSISDELRDGEVTVRQACYLPNVEGASAGPLIGHTGVKGLLLATGHTCWGIQNGPGTGKLISEFVFDGKAKSASIGSLDPRRVL
ncbi:MAG: hypothetical protein LQ338_006861 [Usnochroma carphineum]|nr:MAG: hypothetical protein LQ338_006861 [Usnochroma carphineum]